MKKALIAMSGGVDSSVAAYLMKKQGYECVGCTMKLYDNDRCAAAQDKTCCSVDDVEDARSVAFKLGMPYYVFNFKDSFNEKVIKKFISCYENGTTPNPCIDCNIYLKFNKLYERAKVLGCDYIVTGHYARIKNENGRFILKKALDLSKDQSYVLYSLTQQQLASVVFPLGELEKTQTRKIAEENGFINSNKPDSQDICFVPDGDYAAFIRSYTGKDYPEGNFVDLSGNVLGRHKGIIKYTVGQRRGLGLALPRPMYVCKKNLEKNEVVLGYNEDLMSSEVTADNVNFISVPDIDEPMKIKAKIRYNQSEQAGTLYKVGESKIKVVFDLPQRAVTPGQALVVYDGDNVVCGGTII